MNDTAGYLASFIDRDGEPDLLRRTLPRREAFFERLAREPVRSTHRVDRATFLRNLARRRPELGLDDRMLWVLATAKANQAERFAVGYAELYGRIALDGDRIRLHVAFQECYHTRLLAEAVAMFGVPPEPRLPALPVRLLVKILVRTPEAWHLPLAGSSEMAGCVVFRALRDRGLALFADEPPVAARIRLVYDEILADEIGHVGLITARLGPTGRRVMRRLYRLLGHRVAMQSRELAALFEGRDLRSRFAAFRLE